MEARIKVLSVNISEKKGTIKKPVDVINLSDIGVEKDAHSGPWNRMVSLLGIESVNKFSKEAGREIAYGEFAENITTEGIKLYETKPLDRFINESVEIEVTQIGKKVSWIKLPDISGSRKLCNAKRRHFCKGHHAGGIKNR